MMLMQKALSNMGLLDLAKSEFLKFLINCFTKDTGKVVIERIHNKLFDWLPASNIEYGIENENAGYKVVTVSEMDAYKWEKSIPIEHEYKLYRDIAAYGFDKLYITVVCGTNFIHKIIDREDKFVEGIIAKEHRIKEKPLF